MKKIIFIGLLSLFAISISAQRKVRKETHKGDTNYREQRYGAAEENYKKAIEMYSKNAEKASKDKKVEQTKEAFYNLGNTYYRQGRWDDAIEQFRNYQKLETDELELSKSHRNIGDSYLRKAITEKKPDATPQGGQQAQQPQQMPQQDQLPRMEDLKNSMESYKSALRMNPQDEETRYNLTTVQKMIQDQEDKNKDNKDNKKDQDKKDDKKDQQQKQDQNKDENKEDKKDQQQKQDQMSQESMNQILKAMEQEEKETKAKVQEQKNQERKKAQQRNRQQDKDW